MKFQILIQKKWHKILLYNLFFNLKFYEVCNGQMQDEPTRKKIQQY